MGDASAAAGEQLASSFDAVYSLKQGSAQASTTRKCA